MKTLVRIIESVEALKKSGGVIDARNKALATEITRIENEGRSSVWEKNEIAKVRKKAIEESLADIAAIQEHQKTLNKYEPFWEDTEAVLSCIPLTSRGVNGLEAENVFQESIARMSILSEAKLQSSERLKQSVEYALNRGRVAEAYLLSLEGKSRTPSVKIDLSSVTIPEQERALDLLAESKKIAGTALVDYREINGAKVNELFIARLTVARGGTVH